MRALFSNRYVDAFAKTVLFFGITHLIVLSYAALRGDVNALNAFSIVSLDLLAPGLGKGILNFALSYCMVLVVYLLWHIYLRRCSGKTLPIR